MVHDSSSSEKDLALAQVQIEKLEAQLQSQNEEIIALRNQVFTLRDKIHVLHNSRVVGRIIKTRDKIGNPYTLPFRAANKTRRTVAKFVPDAVRLPLMKSLRKGRSVIRDKVQDYRGKSVTVVTVPNTKWPSSTPLVSVVIPFWNQANTLEDTISSLRAQTFQNFETIIVDDCSDDEKSKEMLKLYEKAGITVIYHEVRSGGPATGRNTGIRSAHGKYIICLDSDDLLEETFIEKATITLELNPDVSLVTTYQDMFGVVNELVEKHPYAPLRLIIDNMVIVAAQFRREAWERSGGYKPDIGYEDWDFWLTLAEHGFWGKLIPEPLFKYRTSMQSRYVEDKDVHWNNIKVIRRLHPQYKSKIRSLLAARQYTKHVVDADTAFINITDQKNYPVVDTPKPNVLITVPWMDFGGVSTLLNNFTHEVADNVNLHFITGLHNKNEWEYKFKEITPLVYHMPNMFAEDAGYQLEFVSNYIATRRIDILHIVHNGFIYPMLAELKHRHPKLKVVVTVFNNRAPYLGQAIDQAKYIDLFTTDNLAVGSIYEKAFSSAENVRVIPNGINTDTIFNPAKYDRKALRKALDIEPDDVAIFYVGRLSEEKNPDLYVKAVELLAKNGVKNAKFFMIGDGPMSEVVQHAVYAIKDRPITYLGYQSDIAEYLATADVFVLPSAVEGFPLSIIEAMAMNVAVVATNVGAVSDVIETHKNGLIVDEITSESIANSIDALLKDRSMLERIKSENRVEVEKKYSNAILGRNYRNLYKELSK